jgi:hypothetical protein
LGRDGAAGVGGTTPGGFSASMSKPMVRSKSLKGTGRYEKSVGHYVHSKAVFKENINNDPKRDFQSDGPSGSRLKKTTATGTTTISVKSI